MQTKGFGADEITAVTEIPLTTVKRIFEEEGDHQEFIKQQWEERTPIMREVVTMGLETIRDICREMLNPEFRMTIIKDVKDFALFTKTISEVNTLLRLEVGQSTQNISNINRSYTETRAAMQNLAKVDPVFNYPVPTGNEGSQ